MEEARTGRVSYADDGEEEMELTSTNILTMGKIQWFCCNINETEPAHILKGDMHETRHSIPTFTSSTIAPVTLTATGASHQFFSRSG